MPQRTVDSAKNAVVSVRCSPKLSSSLLAPLRFVIRGWHETMKDMGLSFICTPTGLTCNLIWHLFPAIVRTLRDNYAEQPVQLLGLDCLSILVKSTAGGVGELSEGKWSGVEEADANERNKEKQSELPTKA
ncbi:unnamed protein product [Protopolystoma xenopodis]|uniref:Uncharacterized protein n=1 Tax=Protopolystoma xenopodis TaxID=117903 RepID=A0A448WW60_9PLAT|nr:unnamed protein product [Protopolystoma xenopodis]